MQVRKERRVSERKPEDIERLEAKRRDSSLADETESLLNEIDAALDEALAGGTAQDFMAGWQQKGGD